MRRWVSRFPKALLEVKEITETRHATGQRKRGNEKLMDYSVRKDESICYFVGLSEYVCDYGAQKNCYNATVYLGLWFRLLCHNYLLFIWGMGRFSVVQTSCTNKPEGSLMRHLCTVKSWVKRYHQIIVNLSKNSEFLCFNWQLFPLPDL